MAFASKSQLKQALTNLHERVVTLPAHFGGDDLLIREVSARVRLEAEEAAKVEDEEQPDNALYRAMLMQHSIVDPESGTPYPDGRISPDTGMPLIDPRTRVSLFTMDEIAELSEGRDGATRWLIGEIVGLSVLAPAALKFRDNQANGSEPDTGPGVSTGGTASDGPTG